MVKDRGTQMGERLLAVDILYGVILEHHHITWLGSIKVTMLLPKLATHTRVMPKATEMSMPNGFLPTGTVANTTPSEGRITATLLPPLFATHMLTPSNAMPAGPWPTGNVRTNRPSLARSFVTVLP